MGEHGAGKLSPYLSDTLCKVCMLLILHPVRTIIVCTLRTICLRILLVLIENVST